MPQRELEICARVRLFRKEHLKWSQPTFARELQVDSFYLSNLEQGRTPLRFALANRMLAAFPLDPQWLRSGEGPMLAPGKYPKETYPSANDDERGLFSTVFDEKIAPFVGANTDLRLRRLGSFSHLVGFGDASPQCRLSAHWALSEDLFRWLTQIPDAHFVHFLKSVQKHAADTIEQYEKDSSKIVSQRLHDMIRLRDRSELRKFLLTKKRKEELTNNEEALDSSPAVKMSLVQGVIAKVKAATEARGSRSRLAGYLGVPPQRLNDWLSGEHEPSAETALRLLDWVTANEAKQKAPEHATNTPGGRKTRSRNHLSHETRPGPKSKSP
jgi:transcriptional regulator with XRE-family HTH domain